MASESAALAVFRSLATPLTEMSMSGMIGNLYVMLSGREFIREAEPFKSFMA